MCNTCICLGITWIYCNTLLGWCLSVKKKTKKLFAVGVLCSSFLNHPALLQWHVITSGQVPRWYKLCSTLLSKFPYLGKCPRYKSPLQLTFGPVSISWHTTGQCPHALQESFAAHLHVDRCPYGGTQRASAHITRILRCSFLDWCPYGGTSVPVPKWYRRPLQYTFGPVSMQVSQSCELVSSC